MSKWKVGDVIRHLDSDWTYEILKVHDNFHKDYDISSDINNQNGRILKNICESSLSNYVLLSFCNSPVWQAILKV
jgi:hypothetical protein